MTIMREIIQKSEWIIPVLLLYVVAWTRFNSPPTNRSSTTFGLFFFGVIFYYALIVALWLLVIIGLVQGSIGFDWIGKTLTAVNPEAQVELAQYAPIFAALIIVVASQFRQVSRIDTAARAFCVKVAAIPREADRLAIMTLANPGGGHFTPASAPIVLRRVVDETPKLGFIQPGAPDFEAYRRELEAVMPAFGFFATHPRSASEIEHPPAESAEDVRVSTVA